MHCPGLGVVAGTPPFWQIWLGREPAACAGTRLFGVWNNCCSFCLLSAPVCPRCAAEIPAAPPTTAASSAEEPAGTFSSFGVCAKCLSSNHFPAHKLPQRLKSCCLCRDKWFPSMPKYVGNILRDWHSSECREGVGRFPAQSVSTGGLPSVGSKWEQSCPAVSPRDSSVPSSLVSDGSDQGMPARGSQERLTCPVLLPGGSWGI